MAMREVARHVEFRHEFTQGRDVVIAFDHRRHLAEELDRASVKVPHGRSDGMVMSIDQMTALIAVARQMELPDAPLRHSVQIRFRVEAVIDAAHVDLVMSSKMAQS